MRAFSAANQSSIAGLRERPADSNSARHLAVLLANMPAGHAPNIRRARLWVVAQVLREDLVDALALEHVRDSAGRRVLVSADLVRDLAAEHRQRLKPVARSARPLVAVRVGSSSIPRQKKGR